MARKSGVGKAGVSSGERLSAQRVQVLSPAQCARPSRLTISKAMRNLSHLCEHACSLVALAPQVILVSTSLPTGGRRVKSESDVAPSHVRP